MEILLAKPRGFCAGVERAITIVEKALEKYGAPVYVRHEIVHNKAVVSRLRDKGAVFVEELDEVPHEAVVIFSAHGVPKTVHQGAEKRQLIPIDATCPLVKKVHSAVDRYEKKNAEVILIGHKGHPEVIGTMGQLDPGKVKLVGSPEEVESLEVDDPANVAYTTQTTLSMFETQAVIDALKKKFPLIQGPKKGDLCYATTNRQQAVLEISKMVDLFLIVGSANSSNSNRLRELGESAGVKSFLIDSVKDISLDWFKGNEKVGISSGASAPEDLVQESVRFLEKSFPGSTVRDVEILEENVHFPLPAELKA